MTNLVNVVDFSDSMNGGDDWSLAFQAAINHAVAQGRGGVFVPANPEPYTVRRPGDRSMCIDLRHRHDFVLAGDGPGSVIQMKGAGHGDWSIIHIGDDATDVVVRDLYLDGNRAELSNLSEHTHLIRIGGTTTEPGGGARGVKVLNCTLARAHGDGVAILPVGEVPDGAGGGGEIVSNLQIAFCSFLDNNRSGISNQRFTERIHILHNHFEGTSDQDIDFEPSSGTLDSGPRGYLIIGNVFVHRTKPPSVTLSGVGPNIPALNNTFAHNQIYGGHLGMLHAENTSIIGNYIEGGTLLGQAVVRLEGHLRGVRVAHNHIVRPAGAIPGQLLAVASRPKELRFVSQPINATTNEFTHPDHGYATGDGPVQVSSSGTLPDGLVADTDYWVIRTNADALQLATSKSDAEALIAVDITDLGVGVQSVARPEPPRQIRRFASDGDIDPATDEFTNSAHGLASGAGPVKVTTTGTLPGGLALDTDYWVIRVGRDVIQLASTRAEALNETPVAVADEGSGIQTVTLGSFPSGVDVHDNRFHSHVGPGGEPALISFRNARAGSFRGNEVHSYSGGESRGLRFETSPASVGPAQGWDVEGNRFRGDADDDGAGRFTSAVTFAAVGAETTDIRVCFNDFTGCDNQVHWVLGSGGRFATVPMATGNSGAGLPYQGGAEARVNAILIGGNDVRGQPPPPSSSTALYCGVGRPAFPAARGSIYMRTDGVPGDLLYVNKEGTSSWDAFV